MDHGTFEQYFEGRVEKCREVLLKKASEYSKDGDRLHNFKIAATLQGVNTLTALAGMMAKHTVSVYDLVKEAEKGDMPPIDLWEEKIGDSINYLFLLEASVQELYFQIEQCGIMLEKLKENNK